MNQHDKIRSMTIGDLEDSNVTTSSFSVAHAREGADTESDSFEQPAAHKKATAEPITKKPLTDDLPLDFPPYYTEWDAYRTSLTFPTKDGGLNAENRSELAENGSNPVSQVDQDIIHQGQCPRGAPAWNSYIAESTALLFSNWQDENDRNPQTAEPVQRILPNTKEEALSIKRRQKRASGMFSEIRN